MNQASFVWDCSSGVRGKHHAYAGVSLRPARPLLPDCGIAEHLDVDATDNRTRLEAGQPAVLSPVPVRERNSRGRLIQPVVYRRHQGLKVRGRFSKRGGPDFPVQFGIARPVIQGKAKSIHLLPVGRDFLDRHLRGNLTVAWSTKGARSSEYKSPQKS